MDYEQTPKSSCTMDFDMLVEVFRQTLYTESELEAVNKLNKIRTVMGFSPSLLEVTIRSDVDMPVRQASAVYLRHFLSEFWNPKYLPGLPATAGMHNEDRSKICRSILDGVVRTPARIRVHLALCVRIIIVEDFPNSHATDILKTINSHLKSHNADKLLGGLVCVYECLKHSECRNVSGYMVELGIKDLFPITCRMSMLLSVQQTEQYVELLKYIFKIYLKLTQKYRLSDYMLLEDFLHFLEMLINILQTQVPDNTTQMIKGEHWWELKKLVLSILLQFLQRCIGGNVEYQFQKHYLETFSARVLEVVLKILDQYINGHIYVPERFIEQCMSYIQQVIVHGLPWENMKIPILNVIRYIIFPKLVFNLEDEKLWSSDPSEYIKVKYDTSNYEDMLCMKDGELLLHAVCERDQDILQNILCYVMDCLSSPDVNHRQKDGIFRVVGILAKNILKCGFYDSDMDMFLITHVVPEFCSVHAHLRGRLCWLMIHIHQLHFKEEPLLSQIINFVVERLLVDESIPVRVEAALALQMLLIGQRKAHKCVKGKITHILLKILELIDLTKNDDLPSILETIVSSFRKEIIPINIDVCKKLAEAFDKIEDIEDYHLKMQVTVGLLNAIETLINSMKDHEDILQEIRPVALKLAQLILSRTKTERELLVSPEEENRSDKNSSEEVNVKRNYRRNQRRQRQDILKTGTLLKALAIIEGLSHHNVTPDMLKVLQVMNETLKAVGCQAFPRIMPVMYNIVTLGMSSILSKKTYITTTFDLCQNVLKSNAGEEAQCYSAKMIEIIILQYKKYRDQVLCEDSEDTESVSSRWLILHCNAKYFDQGLLSSVQLLVQKISEEIFPSRLQTICLLAVVAALFYHANMLLETLDTQQLAGPSDKSLKSWFMDQWLHQIHYSVGIHETKLHIVSLCTLLLSDAHLLLREHQKDILPSLLILFGKQEKTYAEMCAHKDDIRIDHDDHDIDEMIDENLDTLESENDDSDNESLAQPLEQKALESYKTTLDNEYGVDEYIIFVDALQNIQTLDSASYNTLTAHLTLHQQKTMEKIIILGEQRKASSLKERTEASEGLIEDTAQPDHEVTHCCCGLQSTPRITLHHCIHHCICLECSMNQGAVPHSPSL